MSPSLKRKNKKRKTSSADEVQLISTSDSEDKESPTRTSTPTNSDSGTSKDSRQENEKFAKKMQTPKSIQKQMIPTNEELEYRNKRSKNQKEIKNISKLFKCTKCEFNFQALIKKHSMVFTHPLMDVLMCADCCEYFGDGDFSLDSDNEDKYCRWCGEGGTLYTCAQCICGFCSDCIKKHFGKSGLKKVQEEDKWLCYFCNPKPLWDLRFICSMAKKECESEKESVTNKKNENQNENSLTSTTARKLKRNIHSINENENNFVQQSKKKRNMQQQLASLSDESELTFNTSAPASNNVRAVEKLEEFMKLSHYQMVFTSNWSKKKLKGLRQILDSGKICDIKKECEKIKFYFSTASSNFIGFTNAIDLIEKEFCTESEESEENETEPTSQACSTSYSSILRFLDFITNQVNVLNQKGIGLDDLLTYELYEDKFTVGLKKKSKNPENTETLPDENPESAPVEETCKEKPVECNQETTLTVNNEEVTMKDKSNDIDDTDDEERPLRICLSDASMKDTDASQNVSNEHETEEKKQNENNIDKDLEDIMMILT